MQYIFETEEELAVFHGVFGKTTTFGKWCHHPIVGESRYLQQLDIINVVVLQAVEDVENGKWQGIVVQFDGKDITITIHYHKFIYWNTNGMGCPCPVLNAAIAYSSHAATNNHAANAIQIESFF